MMRIVFLVLFALVLLPGCENTGKGKGTASLSDVPEWSKSAIWYQIFVERFRNGDTLNDPRIADMKGGYPDMYPQSWKVTPWGHDWYAREEWQKDIPFGGFYQKIQARRYGGDLQGVLDKLGYIDSLGVNVIYFNPLNDSPSLHKYDARNYTHIDRNFGPDPDGDIAVMASETPDDPSTWKWTSADKLFLKLIDECHKRGIRVVVDYSWNHTGMDFWALNDIREKGEKSIFRDWYNIESFDDTSTAVNEFRYEGWGGGNRYMPVFKKEIIPADDNEMPFEGNLYSESLRKHIFDVSNRWLDPDGDGNPSDGIDGFRLDVAAEVPMGFWREYRKFVRSVNPDAYLVGEVWWLRWPDKLLNPGQFMGDQFDAIMNYRWFRIARGLFGQAEPVLNPTGFVKGIAMIDSGIPETNRQAMMNVAGTHDSPRLLTSLFNKGMDKFNAKPADDSNYKIHKPASDVFAEQKLLLVHQYTFEGAPHIWYGDEVGMWGADDPDCRKPMVWGDIEYEPEKINFDGSTREKQDAVKPDLELLDFYRSLTKLRNENTALSTGKLEFLIADDSLGVLAYKRESEKDEIIALFNRSDKIQEVKVPAEKGKKYQVLFKTGRCKVLTEDELTVEAGPVSAIVLKKLTSL
jgi:glycosidase